MNEKEPKQIYPAVDIAKFFFCLCIIALHAKGFRWLPEGYFVLDKGLFRLAVPFFFVTSGFFLGRKVMRSTQETLWNVFRNYCIHLLKILVIFESINLVLVIIRDVMREMSVSQIAVETIQKIIFHPYGSLWYIQASIIGALLVYPFVKYDKLKIGVGLGVLLYGFALICNSYYFLIEDTFLQSGIDGYLNYCVTARNGLFVGFLYIGMGILCAQIYFGKNGNVFSSEKTAVLLLGVLYAIYLVEIVFVHEGAHLADDGALFITHIFLIPVLLFVLLNCDFSMKKETSVMLRNLSTGMYLLQRPLLLVLSIITIGTGFKMPGIYRFIFVTIASAGLCILYYRRKHHEVS